MKTRNTYRLASITVFVRSARIVINQNISTSSPFLNNIQIELITIIVRFLHIRYFNVAYYRTCFKCKWKIIFYSRFICHHTCLYT